MPSGSSSTLDTGSLEYEDSGETGREPEAEGVGVTEGVVGTVGVRDAEGSGNVVGGALWLSQSSPIPVQ